jgi:hypothetical protein
MKQDLKNLREEYKLRDVTAGIFRVTNLVTGRVFLGSTLNLHGPLNRIEFELAQGMHKNRRLQDDFQRYGRESFTFEVLERIEPSNDAGFKVEAELGRLEARYSSGLDRANCYNEKEDIRFSSRRRN